MLAFFLVMSLTPFVFWLTMLFGGMPALLEQLLSMELFGWARDFLIFLQTNAQGATTGASIFLIATTLWSSSAFFYHLRRSGEIIYEETRPRHGWKVRLVAIGLTISLMLLISVAGALLVVEAYITRYLSVWLGGPLQYSVLLFLGFLMAWGLNLYLCPCRGQAKRLATGSFLTALAWLVATAAFSVYLFFSSQEKLYGALSLVIVFFLWLYWLMICFVAGVIFNKHRVQKNQRTSPCNGKSDEKERTIPRVRK